VHIFIDLHKTRAKVINGPFCTYRRIHFTNGNASFLWYFPVIIRESRISQRPPGRARSC